MIDGLHQATYLAYDEPSVALACLDMAVKTHQLEIPLDQFAERSWRKALYSKAEWSVIKTIQVRLFPAFLFLRAQKSPILNTQIPDLSPKLKNVIQNEIMRVYEEDEVNYKAELKT